MPPTIDDRLTHIQAALTQIESMTSGKTLAQFSTDAMLRAATERFLEIICEASRRLPMDVTAQAPEIAWSKMVDFGNVLRHAYHTTRVDAVWEIVQFDLPLLKTFVERQLTSG